MANAQGHLTPEQVARYVDRTAPPDERARTVAHIADCEECRREVTEVARAVRQGHPSVRWWKAAVPLAAAAVLLIVVGRTTSAPGPQPGSEHRDPPTADSAGPVPRAPMGRTSLPLDLRWSPVTGAREYRVTVFDPEGTIVFRISTMDTLLTVPDTVGLHPGGSYFWRVEADLGTGLVGGHPPAHFTIDEPVRP